MNILVTGSCGFIANSLITELEKDKNNKITCLDNLSSGRKEFIKQPFLKFDVEGNWHGLVKNIDVIFHLAAEPRIQPSFDNPVMTHESNINGTLNILEYARKNGCKVIYAGSSTALGDALLNPYAFTKKVAGEYCQLYSKIYNVPTAVCRFFNCYGKNQLEDGPYKTVIGVFEKQKREGKPLTIYGDGSKKRDMTHVSDIVNGLILASKYDCKGEIFNFGTGKNYSIKEIAEMFEPVGIECYPDKPGEMQETLADITFSREKLGYEPTIDIKDYIKAVIKI